MKQAKSNNRPDWTKLPSEFSYLSDAAERYGDLLRWGQLQRKLSPKELKELRDLALKVGWNNQSLPLHSWLIEHSILGDDREVQLVENLLVLMDDHGFDTSDYGPKEEPDWILSMWKSLHYRALQSHTEDLVAVVSNGEAFDTIIGVLDRVPDKDLGEVAYLMLEPLGVVRTLEWMQDRQGRIVDPPRELVSPPKSFWGGLAALSEFSWPVASAWLKSGRPLSLIALSALGNLDGESQVPPIQEREPRLMAPPTGEEANRVLQAYKLRDPDSMVIEVVDYILASGERIWGDR